MSKLDVDGPLNADLTNFTSPEKALYNRSVIEPISERDPPPYCGPA